MLLLNWKERTMPWNYDKRNWRNLCWKIIQGNDYWLLKCNFGECIYLLLFNGNTEWTAFPSLFCKSCERTKENLISFMKNVVFSSRFDVYLFIYLSIYLFILFLFRWNSTYMMLNSLLKLRTFCKEKVKLAKKNNERSKWYYYCWCKSNQEVESFGSNQWRMENDWRNRPLIKTKFCSYKTATRFTINAVRYL